MSILIIITHPTIASSLINKRWIEELKKYPDRFHIHDLYQAYPTGEIDVVAEQQRITKYEKIIFQFPVYWHSSPPLLKKWIDEVLIYGWAYGSKSGYQMAGKKIALAMSAGVDEYEYGPAEKYKYTLRELTRPFELTFEYIKADYQPLFAYYGIELNTSQEWIERSVPLYLSFLESF
ncbi:NAD(P)H-dependent oxidoreductase [Sphingobacterium sp. LRF_L2]|uniref:NAD(P)H-dependent oxidoreductase n=1 Tax=Sphingobacterium sp. LRF_L2 TaxID=3369421 RepID=UPI003F602497